MEIFIVIACRGNIDTAEPQYPLSCLQEFAIGPYPEPDESGP
jgi:hypothetical protein